MGFLKNVDKLNLIRLIESATELKILRSYADRSTVEGYLGLNIQRSYFYGRFYGSTLRALDDNETSFDSENDITIQIEGIVVLNSIPVNNGAGDIVYDGYGVLEVDGSVIYDGRGGSSSSDWDSITNKPTEFPPSFHTHSLSELEQSGASDGNSIRWDQSAGEYRPYSKTEEREYLEINNVDNVKQIPLSEKGQPNGVAELDSSGKVPVSQLPTGFEGNLRVIGFWDANTNTPDLTTTTLSQGEAYQVSVEGNTSINGEDNWKTKDLIVWDDNLSGNWFKIDNTDDVLSVNGKTGAVVLTLNDFDLTQSVENGITILPNGKLGLGGSLTEPITNIVGDQGTETLNVNNLSSIDLETDTSIKIASVQESGVKSTVEVNSGVSDPLDAGIKFDFSVVGTKLNVGQIGFNGILFNNNIGTDVNTGLSIGADSSSNIYYTNNITTDSSIVKTSASGALMQFGEDGSELAITMNVGKPLFLTDNRNNIGASYEQDYSVNWTSDSLYDNVLATKKYVDDAVGGGGATYTFTNGLTESGGEVKLGGVLTEPTSVDAIDVSLSLTNTFSSATESSLTLDNKAELSYSFLSGGEDSKIILDVAGTNITYNQNGQNIRGLALNSTGSNLYYEDLQDNNRDNYVKSYVGGLLLNRGQFANEQKLVIDGNGITLTDKLFNTGIKYDDNYSANWTSDPSFDNVLVNKKWVEDNFGGGGATTAPNVTFDPSIPPYANLQEFAEDVNEKVKAIVYDEAGFDAAISDSSIEYIFCVNRIVLTSDKETQFGANLTISGSPINPTNITFTNKKLKLSFENEILLTPFNTFEILSESFNSDVRIKKLDSIIPITQQLTTILFSSTQNTNFIYENASDLVVITDDGNPTTIVKQELWYTSPTPVPYTLTDDLVIFDRDIQVPQTSLKFGEAIKMSDLAQSIGYETAYDKKRYVVIGQEVTDVDSKRPIAKEYTAPSEFEIQGLDDATESFTGSINFNITSSQNVYGEEYLLKFISDQDVTLRLYRSSENGGVETKIIDQVFDSSVTNLNGTVLNLNPLVDFELGKVYRLELSTDGNAQIKGTIISTLNPYEISTLDINPNFVPYIKRTVGYVYEEKQIAYLDDISSDLTFSNAIELKQDGSYGLGGLLTDSSTVVTGTGSENFIFNNLNQFGIQGTGNIDIDVTGNVTINTGSSSYLALGTTTSLSGTNALISLNNNITLDSADVIMPSITDGDTPQVVGIDATGKLFKTDKGVSESLIFKASILNGVQVAGSNTAFSNLNCFGSSKFSEGSGWIATSENIVVPSDGTYEISFAIRFNSSAQRSCPTLCVSIDGTEQEELSNNSYIRATSGIFEDSCILTSEYQLTQGQLIGLMSKRAGTVTGVTTTVGANSFFSIKKISGASENTGVSSLNDLSDVTLTNPSVGDTLVFDGTNFVNSASAGGSAQVYTFSRNVQESQWSGNTNVVYANVTLAEADIDDVITLAFNSTLSQTIQASSVNDLSYAYCASPGVVTVVCRVSSFISIPPNSRFTIQLVK